MIHVLEQVNVQEDTEKQFKYVKNRLYMMAWSVFVRIDAISGKDEPDDRPEHHNHNVYSHSF